ncbi:hypothetical protein [Roseomonas sp. BN140053]|uniref:hypothetical protein n=1 Tax=Roseomonas sp. BN140053 TaxID=3391898 RepID=UPI0039EA801A
MIFYGDPSRSADPRALLRDLSAQFRHLATLPPGIGRHAALVGAFLDAGELAQGLADADFAAAGEDRRAPVPDAAMAVLLALARALRDSWNSGFARLPPLPDLAPLAAAALPAQIQPRRAEGFAFYALYPELTLRAAKALAGEPPPVVVGLRSIGTPLAALVAAALDAAPPVTLRPVGHPFRRELRPGAALEAELLRDPAARFALVDEGPGLSGSSFGAVGDFLEDRGVSPHRLHAFPGHLGPLGPQASERHRARWDRIPRYVASFEDTVLRAPRPEHRLEAWVADLTGPAQAPPEEISGGGWRAHRYRREAEWPAVNPQGERRKFLLRSDTGTWLLRFAGLGREGARKLDRARALHAAGFTPDVAGLRHGFLVEPWLAGLPSLDQLRSPIPPVPVQGLPGSVPAPGTAAPPADRPDPVALAVRVGRYLGFRARHFPAAAGQGASLDALFDMACHNTAEALGEAAARALRRRLPDPAALEPRLHRVETDNRLHAWEWLLPPDGPPLKTDALDHHAAHDLIGCQDIAWDIAGAMAELDLDRDALLAAAEREAGRAPDPALVAALLPPYLAFQLGAWTMAAEAAAGWPEEATRLRAAAQRYAARLRALL